MPGGRPLLVVWQHFVGRKEAECKKCHQVIKNARVEKLERHILKNCAYWTTRDCAAYFEQRQRQQNKRRRTSIDSTLPLSGREDGSGQPLMQDKLNKLVSDFILESGAGLQILENRAAINLVLNGLPWPDDAVPFDGVSAIG